MHVIHNPASEFLRLRKVSDDCHAALEALLRAQNALKEGDAFAQNLLAASCSIGPVLDTLNRSLTQVTRIA